MIDPQLADQLLPFFLNEERRAKPKQVLPNELEKDVLTKAVNKGILVKVYATRGAPKKGQRPSGYRFSDLGRSFFILVLQLRKKDEYVRSLEDKVKTLQAKDAPELEDAVKRSGAETVVEAVRSVQKGVWMHLIANAEDARLASALRRIVNAMSSYARSGARG